MKAELENETSGASSIRRLTIETIEGYALARRRTEVLRDSRWASSSECELTALHNATRAWDKAHDRVSRW